MPSILRLLWASIVVFLLSLAPAAAAERAIIILDGSGSMWAQIAGEARISIARKTLDSVLSSVPDDLELGLMTYGHREKGDCADIELLVPPAAGSAAAISEAAAAIDPKGKTPISDAVKLAAEDLRYTEDKATVILITDGIETCEADPCALASELESQGVDFTTHVVGFGLTDEEGRQVACLAENTGGKYIAAGDEEALTEALNETVAQVAEAEPEPAPEPEPAAVEFNFVPEVVLAEGDTSIDNDSDITWLVHKAKPEGSEGEYVSTDYGVGFKANLEPGDYLVRASTGYAYTEMPVTIAADEVASPLFVLNAGQLIIRPLASEGAEPADGATVFTEFPNGDSTTNYGETKIWVPAGETKVTITLGAGTATQTISIAAGETVSTDIVVGIGVAVANAFYVEGMKVEGDVSQEVLEAKKDIQGDRKSITYAYGPDAMFELSPGDYVLLSKLGEAIVETPFTVKSDERTEVSGMLGAGVVAITAPGFDMVEIFSSKKDIQGNRQGFGYGYGGELQTTLPAGDYVVVVSPTEGDKKEQAFTVAAGERNEFSVE